MAKAWVLVRWPAMGATAVRGREADLSAEELHALDIMDLDPAAEERAVAALRPGTPVFRGTEEGLWALLKQACTALGAGAVVDAGRIPLLKLTRRLAAGWEDDPFSADARGCLLLAAEDGSTLTADLCGMGIPATVIGKVTGEGAPVLVRLGGQVLTL